MSDLIRRSDAVKAIASQLAFNAEMKTAEEFSWEEFEGAAGWILEKCKTVDAVPARHGRWIIEDNPGTGWYLVECSECGENVTSTAPCIGFPPDAKVTWDYCPYCGARMDKGGADNETD